MRSAKIREEVQNEIIGWERAYANWFDLSGTESNFWRQIPDNQETEGITSDEFLRRLPDYASIGKIFQERSGYQTDSYRELMETLEIKGTERVLDLGAARCWTTRDFASRGCSCVAIDIVTTKYIGLASSDVYFEQYPGLYWERIRCDMERLPFRAESFDLIFCNAVLHHSKKLAHLIGELKRVLSSKGRIVVVNEPDYGMLDHWKKRREQLSDASDGANENLYSHRKLARTLRRAGFEVNFRSPMWNIRFHAYKLKLLAERWGLMKDGYPAQVWAEEKLAKYQAAARYFYGLGTMGVATRTD
ncbi:class I SAM-dependent methyltransferase [Candidatus Sumerlaeota bacterium]|nr:class I SAM-dependent methyltransferase [Candidatus Sumerlaeota bacterium]